MNHPLVEDLPRLKALAVTVAREAGTMLRQGFSGEVAYAISSKGTDPTNLVTEMDTRAENLIRERLVSETSFAFLGEESGGENELEELTWVVDPIDGTVNFAHGVPAWCVSIALVQKSRPVIGVIYQPVLDEMFVAVAGEGAFLGDQRLRVSSHADLRTALLVTGFPYEIDQNPHRAIDTFSTLLHEGLAVRRLGSAALDLAYVAAGRFEGFWEVALKPWDLAAGVLLVQEAGGRIGSYGPEEQPTILITDRITADNGQIHEDFVALLRSTQQ